MNSVTLIGTLTKDPQMQKNGETKICDLRVVESNGRKESPLYINVSTFGRQAETCGQYLSKGRRIAVIGQLRFREWVNDRGDKRSEHSITAAQVDFLAGSKRRNTGDKKEGQKGPSDQKNSSDEKPSDEKPSSDQEDSSDEKDFSDQKDS
jgi:single-strand DNA-binding protein